MQFNHPESFAGYRGGVTQPSPTLPAIIGELVAFLRNPSLLPPSGWRGPGNPRRWIWLTALQVVILIGVLLPLLRMWQSAFGLASPEAFGRVPESWLVPTVVLLAPILEELLFRGWHSGTRAALWLLGCAIGVAAALALVLAPGYQSAGLGLLLVAVVAAPACWWKLRRNRQPLRGFAAAFPVIFYVTAAVFALVHLSNYPNPGLLSLPLVLPQLWAGLMLGYIRQRVGLGAAIATHMSANACTVALALILS